MGFSYSEQREVCEQKLVRPFLSNKYLKSYGRIIKDGISLFNPMHDNFDWDFKGASLT